MPGTCLSVRTMVETAAVGREKSRENTAGENSPGVCAGPTVRGCCLYMLL